MAEVQDIDHGWDEFRREMESLGHGRAVAVGIQGTEAEKDHGGITNAHLGAVHEFGATIKHPGGTPFIRGKDGRVTFVSKAAGAGLPRTKPHDITIPERSFIRATMDQNASKYADLAHKLVDQIAQLKIGVTQALGLLGARVKADIQNRIKAGIAPPNTPETIRRKGSSKPLIDGGQLVNAITWEIRKE